MIRPSENGLNSSRVRVSGIRLKSGLSREGVSSSSGEVDRRAAAAEEAGSDAATGKSVSTGAGGTVSGGIANSSSCASGAEATPSVAGTAPTVRVPITAPMDTSIPSGERMLSTPSASASSSAETLSVSRVTRVSPSRTPSPSRLCHCAMVAEAIDSPAAGTFMTMISGSSSRVVNPKGTSVSPASTDPAAASSGSDSSSPAGSGATEASTELISAPSAISAMTVPIGTSSPSDTTILMVPAASDSNSVDTLSVSIVANSSPLTIVSPSALCHCPIVAELMDSPAAGILTSCAMIGVIGSGEVFFRRRRPSPRASSVPAGALPWNLPPDSRRCCGPHSARGATPHTFRGAARYRTRPPC